MKLPKRKTSALRISLGLKDIKHRGRITNFLKTSEMSPGVKMVGFRLSEADIRLDRSELFYRGPCAWDCHVFLMLNAMASPHCSCRPGLCLLVHCGVIGDGSKDQRSIA